MYKTNRVVITTTTGSKTVGSVYDSYLNSTKKVMFRLVFALAMAMKITPRMLASFFKLDETEKYAREFNSALLESRRGTTFTSEEDRAGQA